MASRPSLPEARVAVASGAWSNARDILLALPDLEAHAEANELLGLAGWWLDDEHLTLGSRERAYALYTSSGDARGAARVGVWLVWDNLAFRGDFAVASGWMERSRRLLESHLESPEYGWLLTREAEVALFREHDTLKAIAAAKQAVQLGRKLGDKNIEFTALALGGLARVSSGDVDGGMRCLDEASLAATAGEMTELHAVGQVCCWQIFACERLRDYDRAAQWLARVEEFRKRFHSTPFFATCRVQYAGVLMWRGEWAPAEQELRSASHEMQASSRPGMMSGATARLGELRYRQGLVEEAAVLFEQAGSHAFAVTGRARMAFDRGEFVAAAEMLSRELDRLGPSEITLRGGLLELLVRCQAAAGDSDGVRESLRQLKHISAALGTLPIAAATLVAEALAAQRDGDSASAIRLLDRAVSSFEQCGAPFETACARMDLAAALISAGRKRDGLAEATKAAESFRALGAKGYQARAKALAKPGRTRATVDDGGLTRRQIEILRLVAQGQSNPMIARKLKLSEHTVKRHVANLLTRLNLSSRSAAAAYGAKKGLL